MAQVLFLDSPQGRDIIGETSEVLARFILGTEQLAKTRLRYADLKENFNAYAYDDWMNHRDSPIWKFSSGVTPYQDFDDTTAIPIPITHPVFENLIKGYVVSLDFPIWFNLSVASKVVMLVSQDPMPRDQNYYAGCGDAICSTTFGLHSIDWRHKQNGGKRMWLLVKLLLSRGFGVYITDCHKYYIQTDAGQYESPSGAVLDLYNQTLIAEINIIKPSLIIALGTRAATSIKKLSSCKVLPPYYAMPHFSWRGTRAIKRFFNVDDYRVSTIDEQARLYAETIVKQLNRESK